MAISINWPTGVISIPKADLTLIQTSPTEIRELNLNTFRIWLKDLEDTEAGSVWPDTHRHNTEVSVGGLTLARVIEILAPYTVSFEDGTYAVNLVGANSNVGDRINVNQVSVRSFNSAGLISSPEIQFASFSGRVTIDATNGVGGTTYPTGTPLRPVNNLNDALLIAAYRGLLEIHTDAPLTIEATHDVEGLVISGDNWEAVTVEPGANTFNTVFTKVSLEGEMSGLWNVMNDCWILNITNFCGWVRSGSIINVELANYSVENTGQSYFDDLLPFYPGITAVIKGATDVKVSLTGCNDIVRLDSVTAGSLFICGMLGGELTVGASCTGGSMVIIGVGEYINNSAVSVNHAGLVHGTTVATAHAEDAVWNRLLTNVTTPNSIGDHIKNKLLTVTKKLALD